MKTAIVGVGRMGRRHIQVVRQLGWDVVGVFDVSRDSLKLAQDEQAIPSELLFDDLDRLFAEAKPECVTIATTADFHCALSCMAADRGAKFILVEKPMAVSLAECDRMIDACNRAGTKLSVNHQQRFMPQFTEPKRLLSNEAFGGFASMTVVAGNFGFSMNGVHLFETFRFLADEPVVEVTAWFSREPVSNPRGARFQDRAGTIRASTASGKRLIIEIGADQGYGLTAIYASRNGMITVDEVTGQLRSAVREEQYRDFPTTRIALPAVRTEVTLDLPGVVLSTAAVLKALAEGVNSVSGEDGRRALEVLVAAYQSAENGNVPVRLADGLTRERVFPWA